MLDSPQLHKMAKVVPQAVLPVSEQAQIRRDKLAALQA